MRDDGGDSRNRADVPILSAAFDSLVTVFVQIGKILPKLLIVLAQVIRVFHGGEHRRESLDSGFMELVLMLLQKTLVWYARNFE